MERNRIFLVGFMGSGKSTVGPLLASRLGWRFIDIDVQIELERGKTIREIFELEGERYFRELETLALRTLKDSQRIVVALGGGGFLPEKNRDIIGQQGTSVFLDCSLEVILRRCTPDGTRPLLQANDTVRRLYEDRLPVYRQADVSVDVTKLPPEAVATAILETLADRDRSISTRQID